MFVLVQKEPMLLPLVSRLVASCTSVALAAPRLSYKAEIRWRNAAAPIFSAAYWKMDCQKKKKINIANVCREGNESFVHFVTDSVATQAKLEMTCKAAEAKWGEVGRRSAHFTQPFILLPQSCRLSEMCAITQLKWLAEALSTHEYSLWKRNTW